MRTPSYMDAFSGFDPGTNSGTQKIGKFDGALNFLGVRHDVPPQRSAFIAVHVFCRLGFYDHSIFSFRVRCTALYVVQHMYFKIRFNATAFDGAPRYVMKNLAYAALASLQ